MNIEGKEAHELIPFLLKPSSYPHKPEYVKHIQTHASHVFLVPPYVYKVKKPVNFGFLDFSTLDKRRFYCEREVELNRRLCDAYLGVEAISVRNGDLIFGRDGEIVEYAVKMRELPEEYFLKNLLIRSEVTLADLLRIIDKLVEFYKGQTAKEEIIQYGSPDRVKANIDDNLSLTERFVGKTISIAAHKTIKLYNSLFFQKKVNFFRERMEKGFVKDCHGDLHLEHINLNPRGICIYDCIEFNDRFRYIDIASDIAFLAMDLDFNGFPDLAKFFVSEVSRRMNDRSIYEVLDFYKCYRAYVRGKVESLRSDEKEMPDGERRASVTRAKKYFSLALRYALFGSGPALLVIFGLIGTGKSTVADLLSKELSCEVVSSDRARKEIMGMAPTERRYDGFDKGIYTKEVTEKTYRELLTRGEKIVKSGEIAILDASFSKRKLRELVLHAAEDLGIQFYFIQTKTDDETIKKRLIERESREESISDARREIFENFKEGFEEPDELPRGEYFVINTDKSVEQTLIQIFTEIIGKRLS